MKIHPRLSIPLLLIGSLLAGGCLLQSLGTLQTLVLFFQLTEEIPRGEAFDAHTAIYPHEVGLKKQFVRISGRLDPRPEATRVIVQAIGEDATSAKRSHKFSATVKIGSDGSFSVTKKFNKNIAAGTIQKITIRPTDGAIAAGTQIGICVDVTQRKADLTSANGCATPAAPPGDGEAVVVEVQDDAFSPKSVTIQAGDTVRWELTGSSTSHTVTAMSGAFDSGFVFTSAGAFFERKFTQAEDGETFEYSCQTHKACCEMQGSVLVGPNASPPDDGY